LFLSQIDPGISQRPEVALKNPMPNNFGIPRIRECDDEWITLFYSRELKVPISRLIFFVGNETNPLYSPPT
jgi:hypothetical protein